MVDLFAIDENSASVAAIFDEAAPAVGNDGCALAGDSWIVELKVIPGFIAATDQKWETGDFHHAARTVRRNHFDSILNDGFDVRHKVSEFRDCSTLSAKISSAYRVMPQSRADFIAAEHDQFCDASNY